MLKRLVPNRALENSAHTPHKITLQNALPLGGGAEWGRHAFDRLAYVRRER